MLLLFCFFVFFFFKQKTAYEISACLVGSEMCIRDSADPAGKNSLLKSVLDTVWYQKEKKTKPSDFQLTFTLRAL